MMIYDWLMQIVKGYVHIDATYHQGLICATEPVEHAVHAVTVFLQVLLATKMFARVMLIWLLMVADTSALDSDTHPNKRSYKFMLYKEVEASSEYQWSI